MISYIILFVTLCCFGFHNCFNFATVQDTRIWANDTKNGIVGEAIFEWNYLLQGSDNADSINIKCGYYETGSVSLTPVIQKVKDSGRVEIKNTMNNRVSIVTQSGKPRLLSFKLTRVQKGNPTRYGCEATFSTASGQTDSTQTNSLITLEVLDHPQFKECLVNLPTTKAGDQMDFKCYAYGNPSPRLQCQLVNIDGRVDQQYPSFPQVTNITAGRFTLTKYSHHIVCSATAEKTGNNHENKTLLVQSTPFPIGDFIQISSNSANSIRLQWNRTSGRETGNLALRGYRLDWWVSSVYTEAQNKTLLSLPLTSQRTDPNYMEEGDKVRYEMFGLDPNAVYSFRIYAYNELGNGDTSPPRQATPGFSGPTTEERKSDSNTGAIIGGVVGGIVVLVIIVIIVVYCSRKSDTNKRYPTSYVDDAVDYPPNKPAGMYASVDKKQRPVSRSDSTSGYPDVVQHGGDDYPMQNKASLSYEPSNKAYV